MDTFLIGVGIGITSAAILGVVGWLTGAFKAGKNVRLLWTKIRRANKDYELWAERRDRQLVEQMREIDEEHNARGVYHSGLRLEARARAEQEATLDNKKAMTVRSRAIDDAFNEMRKLDLLWLVLRFKELGWKERMRGTWRVLTSHPVSMEEMLDQLLQRED